MYGVIWLAKNLYEREENNLPQIPLKQMGGYSFCEFSVFPLSGSCSHTAHKSTATEKKEYQ